LKRKVISHKKQKLHKYFIVNSKIKMDFKVFWQLNEAYQLGVCNQIEEETLLEDELLGIQEWVEALIEEGYDLDEYTDEELYEAYLEDLDEAAVRTPKKVRGAINPEAQMAGRSDTGKRVSGDEKTGPRYYTLGRSRGARPDAPTQPGQRPQGTPKLASWEKDDIQYRKANLKAGNVHKVGGPKGLPEELDIYDLVSEYLVSEGFCDSYEDASVIMANMSEQWREEIIDEAKKI
jgi:hypothetical protein